MGIITSTSVITSFLATLALAWGATVCLFVLQWNVSDLALALHNGEVLEC
jgi:hypothetical protein